MIDLTDARYLPPFAVPMRGSTYRKMSSLDIPNEPLKVCKNVFGEFNLVGSKAQTSNASTGMTIRNRRRRGRLLRSGVIANRESPAEASLAGSNSRVDSI